MNALNRLTPLELDKAIAEHVDANYVVEDDQYHCRKCDARIEYARGEIAVHDRRFPGCAGPGRVLDVPLPYCPKCEGPPTELRGCVHIRTFAAAARRNFFFGMLVIAACVTLLLWIGMVR